MDDLLGSPQNPPPTFDDDLLGGGPTRPAFEDDFLFGSPATAPTPAAQKPPPEPENPQIALKIAPVKEVAQALLAFVNPNTFFLRYLFQIHDDGSRTQVIACVTNTAFQFLNTDQTVQKEIHASSIIAVVAQPVVVSSFVSKDLELQAIVQISGGSDIHLAFPREGSSADAAVRDFVGVLTAVCGSFGITLPVAALKHNESITDHIARLNIDARIRRQVAEELAYRTELSNEAATLQREESRLELGIAAIRDSNAGHQVVDVFNEIQQLEGLIASFTLKTKDLQLMIDKARQSLNDVQVGLAAEQQRRTAAVRNAVEDAQKARLMKQVADYEIKKVAHRREMDRIAAITAFHEQRSRSRSDRYDVRTLQLRLDDLEEQLEEVQSRLSAKGEDHSKRVKALAENRRRMGQANELLAQLKAEITQIETTPITEDLSERLQSLEVPSLEPVVPTGSVPASAAAAPAKPVKAAQPPPAPAATAKKAVSDDLDDDI
jgi:hypothetical protein